MQKHTQDGQGTWLNPKVHEDHHAHEVLPLWAVQGKPLCSHKSSILPQGKVCELSPRNTRSFGEQKFPGLPARAALQQDPPPVARGSWLLPTPTPRSPPWQPFRAHRGNSGRGTWDCGCELSPCAAGTRKSLQSQGSPPAPQSFYKFHPEAGQAPCEPQKPHLAAGRGTQHSKPSLEPARAPPWMGEEFLGIHVWGRGCSTGHLPIPIITNVQSLSSIPTILRLLSVKQGYKGYCSPTTATWFLPVQSTRCGLRVFTQDLLKNCFWYIQELSLGHLTASAKALSRTNSLHTIHKELEDIKQHKGSLALLQFNIIQRNSAFIWNKNLDKLTFTLAKQ